MCLVQPSSVIRKAYLPPELVLVFSVSHPETPQRLGYTPTWKVSKGSKALAQKEAALQNVSLTKPWLNIPDMTDFWSLPLTTHEDAKNSSAEDE